MTLAHPFGWLPAGARVRAFVVLLAATLAVMAALGASNARLKKRGKGIVGFELAGNLACARAILAAWGEGGKVDAGLNLGLDYLYLVLYASCLSLGCVLVGQGLYGRAPYLGGAGVVLAWAQLAAGLLDGVENYALIRLLRGDERAFWPPFARWCAMGEFVLVAAGLAFVLIGCLVAFIL
jgi:hypothetical protein